MMNIGVTGSASQPLGKIDMVDSRFREFGWSPTGVFCVCLPRVFGNSGRTGMKDSPVRPLELDTNDLVRGS